MEQSQMIEIGSWVLGGSFLLLFLLGATKKVVIFYDSMDVFWTLSPILFMVSAFFISTQIIGYLNVVTDSSEDILEVMLHTTVTQMILVTAALASCFGVYKTFATAIKYNGVVLGLVVAIFKVVSSLIILFLSIAMLGKVFSNSEHLGAKLVGLLIFGLLIWVLYVMINGEDVEDRRMLLDGNELDTD